MPSTGRFSADRRSPPAAGLSKASDGELVDRAAPAGWSSAASTLPTDAANRRDDARRSGAAGRDWHRLAAADATRPQSSGRCGAVEFKRALGDYIAGPSARYVCGEGWSRSGLGRRERRPGAGLAGRRFVAEVAASVTAAGFDVTRRCSA